MAVLTRNNIVTNGLVFYVDAKSPISYTSGSTSWNNIIGSPSGTLINNPPFSNLVGGSFTFGTGSSYVSIPETNLPDWSVSAWFKYNYTPIDLTIFNLPISSGNKSGQIGWGRDLFYGINNVSVDTTGSIYFGTFGNGEWEGIPRFFGIKLDATGSLNTNFDINYFVGQASNQQQTYIGNDGFLYTSGTNLNFFAKRNKETGALLTDSSAASSLGATFIIDEDNRKVYHAGQYTTAFGLPRNYICKFDLDTLTVDTQFNTSGGLTAQPRIQLTSDKFLYAYGGSITSYKGTPINHIIKLNQSGNLDPGFNPGAGFNNTTDLYCALDSQDRLVCVARLATTYSGSAINQMVRINPNGTRDTTFNSAVFTQISGFIRLNFPAIQSDGKILITGFFAGYSGSASQGIVRINPDGTRDTTFNVGTGIGNVNLSPGVFLQPDGKILLAYAYLSSIQAQSYNGTSFKTFIRLDTSGSIDPTFNINVGFTDAISRTQSNFRVRNTAGTLTTVSNLGAWPSLGTRAAPSLYRSVFDNAWYNITYTKDSSNVIRTYTNGILRSIDTFSTASYQNVDLQIDRLATSLNNVASIQIYNRALTQQEITQNYNATKTRFGI